MHFLRRHPFAVEAYFDATLAVTLAAPAEALEPRLYPGLQLDRYETWGFVAIALVRTRRMRPAGWPTWLGRDFQLAGYRLFVRRRNRQGRLLRGLQVLRSETDSSFLTWSGNLLTQYRYTLSRIRWQKEGTRCEVLSRPQDGGCTRLQIEHETPPQLPATTIFPDWTVARRFAGPMPFTFSYEKGELVSVMGRREGWTPEPVTLHQVHSDFLTRQFEGIEFRPAAAFIVRAIDYRWEKGEVEPVEESEVP